MTRDRYHHGDLPDALRAAATDRVREHGAHAFSVRQAARDVGVDVAAVYRHYRDRGALLAAVARDGFAAMAVHMQAELEGVVGTEDRLRAVGRGYVRFALADPEVFRLMFGPYGAGGTEAVTPASPNPYDLLVSALEDLARDERCRVPVDTAATAAWSAVHGLATLAVDGPIPRSEVERHLPLVLDVLLAGLRSA